MLPLSAAAFTFDARAYELDENGDGRIDVNNPLAIRRARNNLVRVELDAFPSLGGAASVSVDSFTWDLSGGIPPVPPVTLDLRGPVNDPRRELTAVAELPEGTWTIHMRVNLSNGQRMFSEPVSAAFDNIVIVSIGDSVSSGEGNPDIPAEVSNNQYGWREFRDHLGHVSNHYVGLSNPLKSWSDDMLTATDGAGNKFYPWAAANRIASANRSSRGYPSLTAMQIEADDAATAVTFVLLAESGGVLSSPLYVGENKTILGAELDGGLSQIDQLVRIMGNTPIDHLLMTGGANDLGFAKVVEKMLTNWNDARDIFDFVDEGNAFFDDGIGVEYDSIDTTFEGLRSLGALDVRNVYVAEYFNPLRDEWGRFPEGQANDSLLALPGIGEAIAGALGKGEITPEEARVAEEYLVRPMNRAIERAVQRANAAGTTRWKFVTGIADAFGMAGVFGHGYEAEPGNEVTYSFNPKVDRYNWGNAGTADPLRARWVRTADESRRLQEHPANRNALKSTGTFHPNQIGHFEIAKRVVEVVRRDLRKLPRIDLALQSLSARAVGTAASPGGELEVTVSVRNGGTATAPAGVINLALTATDQLDHAPWSESVYASLGEIPQPSLGAGQTVTLTGRVTLPESRAPFWAGDTDYNLVARIDSFLWETSYSNNESTGVNGTPSPWGMFINAPDTPNDIHFSQVRLVSGQLTPGSQVEIDVTAASPVAMRRGADYFFILSGDLRSGNADDARSPEGFRYGAVGATGSRYVPEWEIVRLAAGTTDTHRFSFRLPPGDDPFWANRTYGYLLPVWNPEQFWYAPTKGTEEGVDYLRVVHIPDPDDSIPTTLARPQNRLSADGTPRSDVLANPIDVNLAWFEAQAGQRVRLELSTQFDGLLRLFDGAGREVARRAAPKAADGSAATHFLDFTFGASGTYYAGVSAAHNAAYRVTDGGGDLEGPPGGFYVLRARELATSVATGAVEGVVFDDRYNYRAYVRTEPAQSGVTVFLDYNGNSRPDAGEPVAVTDAAGRFRIDSVPAGAHALLQVPPAGYVQTVPRGAAWVNIRDGETTAVEFGNARTGSVSGRMIDDRNDNNVLDPGEPGMRGLPAAVDLDGNWTIDSVVQVFADETRRPIRDNAREVFAAIAVSGAAATLADLRVELDVTHPSVGNLIAFLVSPSGTRIELFSGAGGTEDNLRRTAFAMRGATLGTLAAGTAPFATDGVEGQQFYQARGTVAAFFGENPNGIWQLQLTDAVGGSAGTLNSWRLRVASGDLVTTTDQTGGFALTDLTPGDYELLGGTMPGWRIAYPRLFGPDGLPQAILSGTAHNGVNLYADDSSALGHTIIDVDRDGNDDEGEFGVGGRTIYLDFNQNGTHDAGATRATLTAEGPVATVDDRTVPFPLRATSLFGAINDVDVTLRMRHANWGSLRIQLASPDGRVMDLVRHASVSTLEADLVVTFDDEAAGGFNGNSGTHRPSDSLALFDGAEASGEWTLLVTDSSEGGGGTIDGWDLHFTLGAEPSGLSNPDGSFRIRPLPFGDFMMRQSYPEGWAETYEIDSWPVVIFLPGWDNTLHRFLSAGPLSGAVAGRYVFANGSALDGNDPAATPADDRAIAAGKAALLPGRTAGALNVTGYRSGINGVMIDLTGLPPSAAPLPGDFLLHAFSQQPPSLAAGSGVVVPTSVALRRGAGVGGSDRVTLTLPDGTARNRWLRVIVKPNERTGLARPDVFYFGNLVGETDGGGRPAVNVMDVARTRANVGRTSAAALSSFDFNGDGRINATDVAIVRSNHRRAMPLFTAPAAVSSAAGPGAARQAAILVPPHRGEVRPARRSVLDGTQPDLLG